MNKVKSALIIGAGIATVGAGGIGLTATTSAMEGGTSTNTSTHIKWGDEFDSKLASTLATKYNLSESDVKSTIDQVRSEMMDEWRFDALKQALSDGKITQAQYDHIVAAVKEIDGLRQSYRQATTDDARAEIKAELKTKTGELWTWLKDQKLSPKLLGSYMMKYYGYSHYSHSSKWDSHHSRQ